MRRLALLLALIAAPAAGGEPFAPMAQLEVIPRLLQVPGPFVGLCDDAPFDEPHVPGFCDDPTTVAFTDSISAYWGLDDQFFGASANYESKVADNSLDLTPTNDPLRAPYANRLPAAQFVDGNSEYLSVADPWTSGDIDFSVGCWVYLDDLTGDLPIASKDDGTQREWRLYYDDNTTDAWVFEIFDGAGGSRGTVSLTTPAPAAATWFFVVGGHDAANNQVNISANGSAYTTAATSGVAVDTDDPFELGRMGAATYHDGRLSQCFFIKEELSAADLGDLYNNGVPVPSRQFAARVATAAEGLWDLSELSGNRSDFTSNAVTLTDNASVLHGAGLAPRAYRAADFVSGAGERLSGTGISLGDADWGALAWVRVDAGGAFRPWGSLYNGTSAVFQLDTNSGGTAFRVVQSSIYIATCSGAVALGEWQLVYAEYDATDDQVGCALVDTSAGGSLQATNSAAGPTATSIEIGGQSTAGRYFDGRIGPFMVFSSLLSATQRGKFYGGGQAFSCDTIPSDLPTPTLCWDLDEPSGTRSASIGSADLTDNNTVGQADGIADIPGGVTLRVADFEDTASEGLTRASEAQLQLGDTDYTILAWFQPESTSTSFDMIVAKEDTGIMSYQLYVTASSGILTFRTGVGTATTVRCNVSEATPVVRNGPWYLASAYHDATNDECAIALNDATWTTSGGSVPGTGTAAFGIGTNGQFASEFDGRIGPVAIFTGTILTDAQKSLYFNSGDALACADIEDVVGVAPTLCWNLDEASGTRSAAIGTADLTDNNTVGSTGGLIRGRTGHSAGLSGTDEYFNLDDEAVLSSSDADFCVVAAFRRDSTSGNQVLASREESSSVREWTLSFGDGGDTLTWEVFDTDGTSIGSRTASLGTAVWHQAVACHSTTDDEIQLAVDGGAYSTTSSTGVPADKAADTRLGAHETTEADFYNGVLDEVFYLTTIPSETQVECLWNSGLLRSYSDLVAGACDE